jgi:hypothetical protein
MQDMQFAPRDARRFSLGDAIGNIQSVLPVSGMLGGLANFVAVRESASYFRMFVLRTVRIDTNLCCCGKFVSD